MLHPETIQVIRIKTGKATIINKADFDPEAHQLPGEAKPKAAPRKRAVKRAKKG